MKLQLPLRKRLTARKQPRPVWLRRLQAAYATLQTPQNTAKLAALKLAAVGVILLLILSGSWYVNQRSNGYVTRSFQASGFSYSLKINKSAVETTVSGSKVLQGKDPGSGQTLFVYVGKPSDAGADCTADGNTDVIATEVVDGKQHNVCAVKSLHLYAMSFTHHSSWYFITVFTNTKGGDLNENTVRAIMRSVHVNDHQTVKA